MLVVHNCGVAVGTCFINCVCDFKCGADPTEQFRYDSVYAPVCHYTQEWPIRQFLYNLTDQAALRVVGQVGGDCSLSGLNGAAICDPSRR